MADVRKTRSNGGLAEGEYQYTVCIVPYGMRRKRGKLLTSRVATGLSKLPSVGSGWAIVEVYAEDCRSTQDQKSRKEARCSFVTLSMVKVEQCHWVRGKTTS